jgi:hypothetical protein
MKTTPEILVVQLKRFEPCYYGLRKMDDAVIINHDLSLSDYIEEE